MKTIKNLINLLILSLLLVGCISTKPANSVSRAEKRIIKYNTGIQNQIKTFPSLIDKAYVIRETITIEVPGDSLRLNLLLQEIKELNSTVSKYKVNNTYLDTKLDSLNLYLNDSSVDLNIYRNELNRLVIRVRSLNKENQELFEKYQKLATQRQVGVYEDNYYIVDFTFEDGKLLLDIKNKDKIVSTEVDKEVFDISIRRHFWQDLKFWGFFIILLNIIYFFNSLIYNFLDSIFTGIIKLVRKLFIKI